MNHSTAAWALAAALCFAGCSSSSTPHSEEGEPLSPSTEGMDAGGTGSPTEGDDAGSTPAFDAGTPPKADAGSRDTASGRPEARVLWITRFGYASRADLEALIDRAAAAGFNTILFQVGSDGDAYYQSQRVPWSRRLTGTLGKDPGWDPLRVALDRAHGRGMELHAFWNVFAAWTSRGAQCVPEQGKMDSCELPPASPAGNPDHVLRAHPEYIAVTAQGRATDAEYLWYSPGNEDLKKFLLGNVTELLTKYEVDGLHLDRIRYPGVEFSYDAASKAAYNALPEPRPSYDNWQREQVNNMVARIYAALKKIRPRAVLTASVWGIYKVLPGCNTSEGYGQLYQDSVEWLKRGTIDALVPMIYWHLGTGCTDFKKHLDFFQANRAGGGVIAGTRALDANQPQADKLRARIEYTREAGAMGVAVFSSNALDSPAQVPLPDGGFTADPAHQTVWEIFKGDGGLFSSPNLPPWSTRLDGGTP